MKTQTQKARHWLALLCACVACATGCFTRRTPVKPVINIVGTTHPVIPSAPAEIALEEPPEMEFEAMAPAALVTETDVPVKPRVVPAATPEPAPVEKVPEPTIAPEVTSQELSAAKAETEQNLAMVDKHLTLAWGRKLNASQQELISKVRGFTESAREAILSGDWVRAKNLSKKAELLSEELAASL